MACLPASSMKPISWIRLKNGSCTRCHRSTTLGTPSSSSNPSISATCPRTVRMPVIETSLLAVPQIDHLGHAIVEQQSIDQRHLPLDGADVGDRDIAAQHIGEHRFVRI